MLTNFLMIVNKENYLLIDHDRGYLMNYALAYLMIAFVHSNGIYALVMNR